MKLKAEQEKAINLIKNTNENFLYILPTGFGKTLVFTEYVNSLKGYAIVITPTLSLISDQVLRSNEGKAISITGEMNEKEKIENYKKVLSGESKFLYISPERFCNPLTLALIQINPPDAIIFDEAHCVSSWGPDFRSEFLLCALLCQKYNIRIIACSATMPPQTIFEIKLWLNVKDENIYNPLNLERNNLSLEIIELDSEKNKINILLKKLRSSNEKVLIFVNSRSEAKNISDTLNSLDVGKFSFYYGTGDDFTNKKLPLLSKKEKEKIVSDLKSNLIRGVVCTRAFGLGIDIEDVHLIIHFDSPPDLESYWQECSRGGRDNKKTLCSLFLFEKDFQFFKTNISKTYGKDEQKILELLDFANDKRHKLSGDAVNEYNLHHLIVYKRVLSKKIQMNGIEYDFKITLKTDESYKSYKEWSKVYSQNNKEEDLKRIFKGYISEEFVLKDISLKVIFEPSLIDEKEFSFLHNYLLNLKNYKMLSMTKVVEYSSSNQCKKNYLSNYFGFDTEIDCGTCSYCICKSVTQESVYRKEGKIHPTNIGIFVRSKGEVIIANELTRFGVNWIYEKEINSKNIKMLPDFTITYNKKEYFWEHFGLWDNSAYRKKAEEKIENYKKLGLYEKLLISKDTGIIDQKEIEKNIEKILKE